MQKKGLTVVGKRTYCMKLYSPIHIGWLCGYQILSWRILQNITYIVYCSGTPTGITIADMWHRNVIGILWKGARQRIACFMPKYRPRIAHADIVSVRAMRSPLPEFKSHWVIAVLEGMAATTPKKQDVKTLEVPD